MPRVRTHTLFIIGACAMLACQADRLTAPAGGAHFHLTVDASRYTPGTSVPGSLVNDGTAAFVYSFCSGRLELRTLAGTWETAEGFAYPCAALMTTLAPGDSTRWGHQLPPGLVAGTYRLVFGEFPFNGGLTTPDSWRTTPPFDVAPTPASRGVPD